MTATVSNVAPEAAASAAGGPAVAPTPTQRRWQIIQLQMRAGQAPCFGTEYRHFCAERERCEFRIECLAMRASWR